MSSAGRFASGLLLGAALAWIVLLWSGSDSEQAATVPVEISTTTSTPQTEPFVEPGEIVVGATALLPRELDIDDGVARFSYALAGLGPTLVVADNAAERTGVLTLPEIWVLTTARGDTVDATTGPLATSVSFDLPAADSDVAQIEVVGWRRATPFGERVELPIEVGAVATFRAGEAIIERVLEQTTSTIVLVDFDAADGEWNNGLLRSVEPGWRVAGRSGGGIQFIWDGADAPQSVTLEDVSFELRPSAASVVVHTIEDRQ